MEKKYSNEPHPTLLQAQQAGTRVHDADSPFPGTM
jgi:hypothetical protein